MGDLPATEGMVNGMNDLRLPTDGEGTIPAEAIAALRAHPQFPTAMRQSARSAIALHRGGGLLGWLMGDRARAIFSYVVIYLDATHDPTDPRSGVTASRVKEACAELGLCSPNRAAAMLALMRAARFVAPVEDVEDARVRRLAPTEKLRTLQNARITGQLGALALLDEKASEALRRLDDPAFETKIVLGLADYFFGGVRILQHAPELTLFAERSTGMVILLHLLLDLEEPDRPIDLSIAELSRRFGVSRAHIIRLLRDAEAQGLASRVGSRGESLVLSPVCVGAAQNMVATMFALFRIAATRALEAEAAGAR